jgi:hypothetical protein
MPPIYHTVKKLRQAKLMVRHLNGGGIGELDCTNLGASNSTAGSVGSFVNADDKRHNLTTHRHDHTHTRNISFSFNPESLQCNTCSGEHRVLRRSVEGGDVGMDNPPLFVLSDQNFPCMVPVEGEGECLKIILVENGSLADLVEVFLGVTRGFDVPVGAVVLMASASHAAAVGAADYAADFVRASGTLRGAFAGSVTVMHGIPFLLGGTKNTPAIRAIAEIEQWVSITTGTDTISATRSILKDSFCTHSDGTDHRTLIRLPISQTATEKCTFESMGFGNLRQAIEPISEDFERYMLGTLIDELNALYPLNLATDFICDRFLEDEVFDDAMNRTALVLVGASHLRNLARFLDSPELQVFDLTTPGWKITDSNVKEKTAEIVNLSKEIDLENATVILQLYDNSVFMVGLEEPKTSLSGTSVATTI